MQTKNEKPSKALEDLDTVEQIIIHAQYLTEEMTYLIDTFPSSDSYTKMSTGAFGILGVALDKAYELISQAKCEIR